MQSVNPSSFSSGMTSDPQNNITNTQSTSPDLSSGQFSVNSPSTSAIAMPQSNPITQNANSVATNILANATAAGDAGIRNATQSAASSGGDSGGGIFGDILGGIGKVVGIGSALFSDRRLKDDMGVVGKLNDGLPVHLFKYKGDETPQIGLMADEVQKVNPGAVKDGPGGYKMVNYEDAAKSNKGYADGGQVTPGDNSQVDPNKLIGFGYLIGALHQRDFNGTPDTLSQAADAVKQKLAGDFGPRDNEGANNYSASANVGKILGEDGMANIDPNAARGASSQMRQELQQKIHPGFAAGGDVSADASLAQQSLMQALGLNSNTSSQPSQQPANQDVPQPNISTETANATQAANQGQLSQQEPQNQSQPQTQEPGNPYAGYMQQMMPPTGLAMGGPPPQAALPDPGGNPQDGPPPLQPGQTFQGDGSVKGPGGPTDDAIPAKLSNGEFVMSVPAVQFFGVDKLVKMNEQGKQGYMQALGQVQANQSKGPAAAGPQAPPQMPPQGGPPPQQPPMMQARGGPILRPPTTSPTMRNRSNGFMGL